MAAPMVHALLAGRKVQMRQPARLPNRTPTGEWRAARTGTLGLRVRRGRTVLDQGCFSHTYTGDSLLCPYGQPGDRLYVRHAYHLFPVHFKHIEGWQGRYAVGTDGLVYDTGDDRDVPVPVPSSRSAEGELWVSLGAGGRVTMPVDRLVCEAFYGPSPSPQANVRHMDGDRSNNRPENLDWTAPRDGTDGRAQRHDVGDGHLAAPAARLTAADAQAIRTSPLSHRALARQYGVSQSAILEILTGKAWTAHAPGPRTVPAWRPWRTSILMPRWASRITLEIGAVRVERLQDISKQDAHAEGIGYERHLGGYCLPDGSHFDRNDPRASYWSLWDASNGLGSAATNPWCWVMEFRRVVPG